MDRDHSRQGRAQKNIYVYPLCRNVQQRLVRSVTLESLPMPELT
jgi:hypothetical protein